MEEVSIKYDENDSKLKVKDSLLDFLKNNENIVILCVGSDRSTGDSLAPLVGTFINRKVDVPVFGTLENPVHAKNLEQNIAKINKEYNNPFIIVIGGSLGTEENLGSIIIREKSIKPGTGVYKYDLPEVGNVSISGVVNYYGSYSFVILQNTRLYIVFEIAKVIANGIIDAFNEIEY